MKVCGFVLLGVVCLGLMNAGIEIIAALPWIGTAFVLLVLSTAIGIFVGGILSLMRDF